MALTTYRSTVPITTQARKEAAYQRASELFQHAVNLGVDVLRVQYMNATQYIEVDLTDPLTTKQRDHLGLDGPI